MQWSSFVAVASALCAAFVFACGCGSPKPAADPLAGWQIDFNEQPDQVVVRDYQDYLQKLPGDERKFAAVEYFYKDGAGQHAIKIEVALNGTDWAHVLFYDKQGKRIKVIKYVAGHYRC